MKLIISEKQLISLLQAELGTRYDQFETRLVMSMHRKQSIWIPRVRDSDQFIQTLLDIVPEYKEHLSPTIQVLMSSLRTPIPTKGVKKQTNTTLSSTAKSVPLPVVPSKKTIRKVSAYISDNLAKIKFSCSIADCEHCKYIAQHVAWTKCSHPKPHECGWFPHLQRRLSRRYHATHDPAILKEVSGYIPESSPSKEKVQPKKVPDRSVPMEVFDEGPSSAPSPSKKRRRARNKPAYNPEQDRAKALAVVEESERVYDPVAAGCMIPTEPVIDPFLLKLDTARRATVLRTAHALKISYPEACEVLGYPER